MTVTVDRIKTLIDLNDPVVGLNAHRVIGALNLYLDGSLPLAAFQHTLRTIIKEMPREPTMELLERKFDFNHLVERLLTEIK